ncbi:hypothetical protein HQ585_01800 [candidate division KSB1 bacterium]|nr:hypothetical protein [candidate division KSB1 bacterium]
MNFHRHTNIFFILALSLLIHCKGLFNPDSDEVGWSDVQNGLRFRIYTDKTSYKVGEDIWLHVEFQNFSPQPIVILVTWGFAEPQNKPLYDLEKLILPFVEVIPLITNRYVIIPSLFKLLPMKTFHEQSKLNQSMWVIKEIYEQTWLKANPFLEPGEFKVRAVYHWEELPYAIPERQQELAEMDAPLWKGYLESNEIEFTIIE